MRAAALARRDALPLAQRIEAALAVADHGVDLDGARTVAGYWRIRSELDVRPLMARLGEGGARLALPAVVDTQTIRFRVLHRESALVAAGFGTLAPGPDAAEVDPDLVLVPLAAFDAGGNRIGYGKGFYDRAIADLHQRGRKVRTIGIGFDCQEVPAFAAEPHDMRLDAVLTESGLRSFHTP